MKSFLSKIPAIPLGVAALFMLLAPFSPMPHAFEKISLLFNGQLSKPIDIFDLFFHLTPALLLLLKLVMPAETTKDIQ
ncbi:MAG: RND transporter [Proteobacteria bacterium]|nr:RND transporter [Pseudomonadota bacterium]MBU1736620.1 RND transporter [Pseudomonadota bacterium]